MAVPASPAGPPAALPAVLPVFPLTGSLLLPGNWLPLNVFEPRYRHLVEDATGAAAGTRDEGATERGERWIGMIQPRVPHQDNWPALDEPPANPELYDVGCAGRIERCEPQADGRYLVLLKGVSRFRVRRELALVRGYRRVAADYAEFAADLLEPQAELDPAPLLRAVREYGQKQGLSFDLDVLGSLPGVALLNGLAVALPFRPAEKQALLEADGPHDRRRILLALMGMGIEPLDPGDYYSPPTVH
ncbi:MAG TPA: LON peptidase substrate-binding domain-containing protein [Thermoanaerobaculia bacterium]|nr:LON peptidase substrate-binding domain-containing protein [Thermoanaerobaculia bacterium]